VTISNTCTLDLNGMTLDLGNNNLTVNTASGNLTIRDSTATTAPIVSDDYSTVTYTAGEIKSTTNPLYAFNAATITLESGKITSTAGQGVVVGYYAAPRLKFSSSFVMNGGYIQSQEAGIFTAYESTAQINGGVIKSDNNGCIMDNGSPGAAGTKGSTVNVTGGTLIADMQTEGCVSIVIYRANKGTLNVTGGKLVSLKGTTIVARSGDVNISGNTEMIALGVVGKLKVNNTSSK